MSFPSILVLILVVGLTTWLIVDTVIYIVKKSKSKKLEKQNKEESKQDSTSN